MRIRWAPSLLAADYSKLAAEIEDAENAGADLIHLDIMDGHFVPNLTFGVPIVRAIARTTRLPLDAHLMVTNPDEFLEGLGDAGVARIAVHVESNRHLHRTLSAIRELDIEAGIAINPATAVGSLEEALVWADFVLVMSVNPGFGGQEFIPESIDKIRRLRALVSAEALDISVDGGIGLDTARLVVEAGATTLVAGSAVFGAADRARALRDLRRSVEGEAK